MERLGKGGGAEDVERLNATDRTHDVDALAGAFAQRIAERGRDRDTALAIDPIGMRSNENQHVPSPLPLSHPIDRFGGAQAPT